MVGGKNENAWRRHLGLKEVLATQKRYREQREGGIERGQASKPVVRRLLLIK